ncbi:unnamed protein product [Phytophthora fragariaefolia]|uniref:Unnamed protein product n=1 Tax=Phytophthora fragariaefolia TaxID=1490495 RepID=A0A9W6XUU2_9STRA|nr:unnamed protein product [Phytophthora fragariaefolia]
MGAWLPGVWQSQGPTPRTYGGKCGLHLTNEVVLQFGVFRELLADGAPELTERVIERLVDLLQARQTNPMTYHPQMIGLVERFHRTWKGCVAAFMAGEKQDDWSD